MPLLASGPDPLNYGWWLTSRAAGIVGLIGVTTAAVLGLLMANGIPARPGVKVRLRALHESIALAALVALAVHGISLLGDRWLKAGPLQLGIPFANPYRPLYTGLGVIAGYAIAILALSFYARRRIGARRWRSLHRLTAVAYALAIVHVLGAGTDAGQPWMRVPLIVSVVPVAGLLTLRLVNESNARAAAPAPPAG